MSFVLQVVVQEQDQPIPAAAGEQVDFFILRLNH
jgi:hypothetical protein